MSAAAEKAKFLKVTAPPRLDTEGKVTIPAPSGLIRLLL